MPVADHGGGEPDHPSRHTAMGEEVAGEDEERDRHDLEALDAGKELERDRLDRNLREEKEERENGEAERDRDRHTGQHQRDEQAEDDERVHRTAFGAETSVSMPSTCAASWCGSSPVRQNFQPTCRKRKHIR